jgi:hypothetical protein
MGRLFVATKIVLLAINGDKPATAFTKPRFWRSRNGSNPPDAKETIWSRPKGLPKACRGELPLTETIILRHSAEYRAKYRATAESN